MYRTALLVSIALSLVACAVNSEEDTANEEAAQTCGSSPAGRTPIEAMSYVMTAPGGRGEVLTKLVMEESSNTFKAVHTNAEGVASIIEGNFRITTPRCPTSDRLLALEPVRGEWVSFNVKPRADGSLVFEQLVEGSRSYAKFTMKIIPEGGDSRVDLQCAVVADCPTWAVSNDVPSPRCGSWTCSNNLCTHSSWANAGASDAGAFDAGATRSCQ